MARIQEEQMTIKITNAPVCLLSHLEQNTYHFHILWFMSILKHLFDVFLKREKLMSHKIFLCHDS